MSKMIEVFVPDIGDFDEVEVIEILVSEGDSISVEDSLVTVESDKATMEIPSSHAGVVAKVKVNIGDKVSEGSLVILLDADSASAEPAAAKEQEAETSVESKPAPAPALAKASAPAKKAPAEKAPPTINIDHDNFKRAHASPAVRKFARELGVDLTRVSGTGNHERILRENIQDYVKQALREPDGGGASLGVEPMPEVDFSQWGDVETKKLSKINILTGKFMHRNWVNVPHVTQFDEADITELEAFRKKTNIDYADKGIKVTMLSFIMKAVVMGLKEFPRFNSSLDASGEALIQKNYFHIGIAVATPDGLVVPVIRDVDQKSLSDLAAELRAVSIKARDKKLKPSEMQGGCFTISSLGGIGGTSFTPIINAPEVAILGVSRSKMQPVWNGSDFEPRLMCPLSLSYDHRVIDGAEGAAFSSYLSKLLSDVRYLLM
ncbi:MAG: dihydrolipoyllysine-residue acetyltransferase [gamma proteobacterium symbiont of Bathyaustriella thionipta]|nr:dihydrolipoyllysine-residue acetyltransferase [gamma proteobacterium symbiont of Bathyaustriella thionipta]MCU7950445.1 dihydrolipoyllysine-residue acetyltransferase [gamma proteobacterium symbiont of Bathyaustriella thionipta]MCU7954723.1 dihydrolipoyllysine-residue acetyltransferase [gamma proteobacterium symbiont of Bathyaustriella thionipta]MCU7956961.1 dihydrolipoyllysine-residue acetyltransferase [gamma proteobacterium symbiont of Bathyaustriella thionipta]MCU7966773.1 dihydrolipoyllys